VQNRSVCPGHLRGGPLFPRLSAVPVQSNDWRQRHCLHRGDFIALHVVDLDFGCRRNLLGHSQWKFLTALPVRCLRLPR
jgi:hypothetical protein